jgi:signal transduction histidine kinase/phage shock protein PspC (stress-responsive transcriptional regulator)
MTLTGGSPMAVGPGCGQDHEVALTRSPDRLVGGVCAGIAEHFEIDPVLVRVATVLVGLVPVVGVLAYAAAWWSVPLADRPPTHPERFRPPWLLALQRDDPRTIIGATCLGLGAGAALHDLDALGGQWTILAVSLVATGVAVAWVRTAPEERSLWRLAGGMVLVVLGMLAFVGGSSGLDDLGVVLLAAAVTAVGIGLLLGPWAIDILRVAGDERRQRIRTEERAELAAQLHDSVLQTLVLIQRSAPSRPTEAVALARRQERELRSWLYGEGAANPEAPTTFAAALEVMAADVEVAHDVEIELVTVGDRPLDEATAALVAATREALVNAAKHAGVPSVDCYAETDATTTRVFVRDRGSGFDPAAVPSDRRGISDSIEGRLSRVGGRATIGAVAGAGTEVTLELDR